MRLDWMSLLVVDFFGLRVDSVCRRFLLCFGAFEASRGRALMLAGQRAQGRRRCAVGRVCWRQTGGRPGAALSGVGFSVVGVVLFSVVLPRASEVRLN